MSFLQLLVLAIVAMGALAALRLVRVQYGRTPLPDARALFLLAFAVLPPTGLAALIDPKAGAIGGLTSVPLYALLLAGLAIVMWIVSAIAGRVVVGRFRPLLIVALTGSEGSIDDVQFDPPLTARLAESVAVVDRANQAFPRGHEFPLQVERAGFRAAWDSLSTATERLESQIADDHHLGVVVASSALATAKDARARLDTLHRLAVESGQPWPAGPLVLAA